MQIRREIRMWSDWGREFFPELKQETLREIERCGGVWPFLRSLRLEMRSHGGVINYMRGCVNDAIACRNFHVRWLEAGQPEPNWGRRLRCRLQDTWKI